MVVRRGKKRALIAVGHKILIAAYFILKDQVAYKDLGVEFLENKRNYSVNIGIKGFSSKLSSIALSTGLLFFFTVEI